MLGSPFDHAHRAEMRRYQPVEPMVVEDPLWLRRLIRAANVAAGLAILILLPVSLWAYETRLVPPVAHSPGATASAIPTTQPVSAAEGAAGQLESGR